MPVLWFPLCYVMQCDAVHVSMYILQAKDVRELHFFTLSKQTVVQQIIHSVYTANDSNRCAIFTYNSKYYKDNNRYVTVHVIQGPQVEITVFVQSVCYGQVYVRMQLISTIKVGGSKIKGGDDLFFFSFYKD